MNPVRIPIGQGSKPAYISGQFANRHGLIAGATGSGKSYTLATLAEGFSRAGVPVFLADVKGDLAGLASANPVRFYDPLGDEGEPFRLCVSALGAPAMARALQLSDAQSGALDVAFEYARATSRPLCTLQHFRTLLADVASRHKALSSQYGLISPASVSAVQRALIGVERDGGAAIFGAQSFDVAALLDTAPDGRGIISVLDSVVLSRSPTLYGAALLFVLGDLFERLPEVGDQAKPRLVLFLDEAHLLFADAPPAILQRVERIMRLIRSRGVGVYFASQSPADIPPVILGQLGNRVQHAMRGATAQDQREIRATADCLPSNPKLNAATLISTMSVGQALVSTVGEDGRPQPVDLVRVSPPRATLGPWSWEPLASKVATQALPSHSSFGLLLLALIGAGLLWGVWTLATHSVAAAAILGALVAMVAMGKRHAH